MHGGVPNASELYIPAFAQTRIRATGRTGADAIAWTLMRLSVKRPGAAWCLGCNSWFAFSQQNIHGLAAHVSQVHAAMVNAPASAQQQQQQQQQQSRADVERRIRAHALALQQQQQQQMQQLALQQQQHLARAQQQQQQQQQQLQQQQHANAPIKAHATAHKILPSQEQKVRATKAQHSPKQQQPQQQLQKQQQENVVVPQKQQQPSAKPNAHAQPQQPRPQPQPQPQVQVKAQPPAAVKPPDGRKDDNTGSAGGERSAQGGARRTSRRKYQPQVRTIQVPQAVRGVAEEAQKLLFESTKLIFNQVVFQVPRSPKEALAVMHQGITDMEKTDEEQQLYFLSWAHSQLFSAEMACLGYRFVKANIRMDPNLTTLPPVEEWLTLQLPIQKHRPPSSSSSAHAKQSPAKTLSKSNAHTLKPPRGRPPVQNAAGSTAVAAQNVQNKKTTLQKHTQSQQQAVQNQSPAGVQSQHQQQTLQQQQPVPMEIDSATAQETSGAQQPQGATTPTEPRTTPQPVQKKIVETIDLT